MSLMEGQKDIYRELKDKFWPTFWVSSFWIIWACILQLIVVIHVILNFVFCVF
jgi:hypothetical protein